MNAINTSGSQLHKTGTGRLSREERRRQLLDVALVVIREEGADRLTLGHLAARAGVSKPIAYEHFGTRSGLLIELYKWLDSKQVEALREALKGVRGSLNSTADVIATAYIHCSADTGGEWHALGAALSGSEEMGAVHQELLNGYIQLFASALEPCSTLSRAELERRCVGLVGAGESLSVMMLGGQCSEKEAAETFASLIQGGLCASPPQP
ncbi:TetR/AcrR family transcriptional regulator [bacterium]|nr:MAG: TetR/AcrR family transcriptional regulator [bacterium]